MSGSATQALKRHAMYLITEEWEMRTHQLSQPFCVPNEKDAEAEEDHSPAGT